MPATFQIPGPNSFYIPSPQVTGLIVSLISNPSKFAINEYIAKRPSDRQIGVYLELDSSEAIRVTDVNEYNWASGTRRPDGSENTIGARMKSFKTQRRNITFEIPNEVIDQADYDVMAHYAAGNMTRMWTLLTKSIISYLETTTNWVDAGKGITHHATATALGGGLWGAATAANQYIRKTLDKATENIMLDSNGVVDEESLVLVLSPGAARQMVATGEFQDYLKNNSFALANVMGTQLTDPKGKAVRTRNRLFGLPNQIYGWELVVEDAVINTARKGAAPTRSFVKSDNSAILLSRQDALPGDRVGSAPVTNYSTFQLFYWDKEATYATTKEGIYGKNADFGSLLSVGFYNNLRDEIYEGFITSNWATEMVAPETGYLITNLFS